MLALISTLLSWLACRIRSRAELELELVALRHQVAVLNRQRHGRLPLCSVDRLVWVCLYRVLPRCLEAIVLVKPTTVVQFHRQGFRLYWRWRSRSGQRPIAHETRKLIREVCFANPLWAPRIHAELLKLGIEISHATVAKYMLRRPHSPSPTWRTFLRNHALGIAAIDMFAVPSATFRLLFRNAHTDPRPPEDCPLLDHLIVFNERHLRCVLSSYQDYYHRTRTHLSLRKDCPDPRPVHPPTRGNVIAIPQVGGLHQRYERLAA